MDGSKELKDMEIATSPAAMKVSHREHKRDASDQSDDSAPYAEHGPMIDRSQTAEMKKPLNAGLRWPRIRHVIREAFSEVGITRQYDLVPQVEICADSHSSWARSS